MSQKKYDLAVAYRIYPRISKNPPVYKTDKYALSEFCISSFKRSLGDLKVKMIVLLDGCPDSYEQLFRKFFDDEDIIFHKLNGIGNHATFELQIQLLLEQSYAEYVYFAEDDYLYKPNQFHEIFRFMMGNDIVDFVTPYDHPDYYVLNLHKGRFKIVFSGKRHWRTASSTTLTFLTTKKILQATKDEFFSYSKGNHDCSMWFCLTKSKQAFNPGIFIKRGKINGFERNIVLRSWFYCWKQLLFGRKRNLWVPVPSIATHMEAEFLAPTMDESYIRNFIE